MLIKATRGRKPAVHTTAEVEATIADARDYLRSTSTLHSRLPHLLNESLRKLSDKELWERTKRGDVEAESMFRLRASVALHEAMGTGCLSPQWAAQILQLLRFDPPPGKRKRGRRATPGRDYWIVGAIQIVMERGFDATRNRTASDVSMSASAIVAAALQQLNINLTERAVEKIWQKRDPL